MKRFVHVCVVVSLVSGMVCAQDPLDITAGDPFAASRAVAEGPHAGPLPTGEV